MARPAPQSIEEPHIERIRAFDLMRGFFLIVWRIIRADFIFSRGAGCYTFLPPKDFLQFQGLYSASCADGNC